MEISGELFDRAKETAQDEPTTLPSLIEQGLRQVLEGRRRSPEFELRDASVDGEGLAPEFREGIWERNRDASDYWRVLE
ncbi:MAG: DUF2191 domain-containing protein [Acidobacteriota bacterium]